MEYIVKYEFKKEKFECKGSMPVRARTETDAEKIAIERVRDVNGTNTHVIITEVKETE